MINELFTSYLPTKPDTSPAPMTMVKSHEKECKFYFRSMVKCCRNANFKEIDTDPLTEKKSWILITVRNI